MGLTEAQESEIVTRLRSGEIPQFIIENMGVTRSDFRAFMTVHRSSGGKSAVEYIRAARKKVKG